MSSALGSALPMDFEIVDGEIRWKRSDTDYHDPRLGPQPAEPAPPRRVPLPAVPEPTEEDQERIATRAVVDAVKAGEVPPTKEAVDQAVDVAVSQVRVKTRRSAPPPLPSPSPPLPVATEESYWLIPVVVIAALAVR